MSTAAPRKDQRFEFRTSSDDRDLFARAAEAAGVPVSTFANEELRIAAQRTLADRAEFALSPVESALWEELNGRPARDLPELEAFLREPSVFVDE